MKIQYFVMLSDLEDSRKPTATEKDFQFIRKKLEKKGAN
jgi:hypothetical protein